MKEREREKGGGEKYWKQARNKKKLSELHKGDDREREGVGMKNEPRFDKAYGHFEKLQL